MSDDTARGCDHSWWRHAVIYEVYPRSFADDNSDGTGDLAGVRSRLPYLRDLGVDALWFTPWYVSPLADGGYDVLDYRAIDPAFGSLQEAEALIDAAAALGIRTIIDVVPNHVSDQHPWFRAALAAGPGSPERERFWFRDGSGPRGDTQPTEWVSSFQGNTWSRTSSTDGTPGQWYLHLFTPEQPDLNWNHADVDAEHESILRFWFDRGAAGIRIDSAALLVKDPALPEVPDHPAPGEHPFVDRDGVHDIYQRWRKVADSYSPPRVLIGELWVADRPRFAAYLGEDELHTAFNFDFMARAWDAGELRESIQSTLEAHAPVGAPATWMLSNHDVTRAVTRYGRQDTAFAFETKRFGTPTDLAVGTRRGRAAALLTAALPGCLYIYQGDELGLPEVEDLPPGSIQDPMHFRSDGVDPGRDGCRVPMPWTDDPATHFGFSGASAKERELAPTWLPQPAWWGEYAVSAQLRDPGSMLCLYRAALALRRDEAALRSGEFAWLDLPDAPDTLLAFRRGDIVCLLNLGEAEVPLPGHTAVLLASGELPPGALPPDTAIWLRLSRTPAPHPHGT